MVKTGSHQFHPHPVFEYWSVQNTVLDIDTQRNMLSILKKSGDKIMAWTTMWRGERSMGVGGHVDVMEKLGYYLSLKEMNNSPL